MYTNAELFDAHRRDFRSDLPTVRAAILRAIRKTSIRWSMGQELRVDSQTIIFHCTPSGILMLGRRCSILASEVAPGEVQVYAKFWDYIGTSEGNSLIDALIPDKFVPVHKKFFKPDQATAIEQRRRDITENFFEKLQSELR